MCVAGWGFDINIFRNGSDNQIKKNQMNANAVPHYDVFNNTHSFVKMFDVVDVLFD